MSDETITQDSKTVIEEKVENTQVQAEAAPVVVEQETEQQINWKKFREQREIERKQKEAAEKRAQEKEAEAQALKAAMDALLNKPAQRNYQNDNHYESQDDELSEDDRIQKKVEAAIAAKEKQYAESQRQRELQEYPQRLNNDFRDFNQVCTPENLDYLEYHYPEVASAFKYAPEGYDKWASIYKAVKRFIPNSGSGKEAKKAAENFNKPQSMAVPGSTPTGDTAPMMLDDKRRADNWARMQRVIKGG